jgi:hypothetical protein
MRESLKRLRRQRQLPLSQVEVSMETGQVQGNFIRRSALPGQVAHWSLSSIQLKLIKIGARIVSHSRMTIFQMAEVMVPEKLFRSVLSRIHRLGKACARAPALNL